MKQLIVLRHAQAYSLDEWWFIHDFYRTLSKKWQHQAKQAWIELKNIWIKPDFIITSSAPRAYETAIIVANELRIAYQNIIIHSECYCCNKNERIEIIWYYKKYNTILICGHNPELLSLCQHFDPDITILEKWQYYVFNTDG